MSFSHKIMVLLGGVALFFGLVFLGTIESLPLSLRYMIGAVLPALLLILVVSIFIYALWSSWKHRNTASLLLVLVSLMVGLMAGQLWWVTAKNYGAIALQLMSSKNSQPQPMIEEQQQQPEEQAVADSAPKIEKEALPEEKPEHVATKKPESNVPAPQAHEGVIEVKNKQELDEALKASSKPVILKGSTAWCPPCKQMKPIFAKLAQEMGDKITFIELDADNFAGGESLKIQSLPTFIGYKNGKEIFRFVGGRDAATFKKEVSKLL